MRFCSVIIAAQAGLLLVASMVRAETAPPATGPEVRAEAEAATSQPADCDDPTTAPPARRDPFSLRVADLYVGMEAEYEYRRVRSSVPRVKDTTHTNRDFRLSELAGIAVVGDVYDPNLLSYQGTAQFGLEQDRFKESINDYHKSETDHGFLHEYDFSLDALRTKPVSLNAYARRADNRIARRFLPSLHELTTEAGISALAVTGPVTTEVGYSYREVDRRGNRLIEDNESLTTDRFYLDSKWAITDGHDLRVNYDHQYEDSNYQGSLYQFTTRRDEVRIEDNLRFGTANRHALDTFLRYNDENGDLARSELELTPRLTLKHSDAFSTIHRYGFYQLRQQAIDLDQHKFDTQALYRPNDRWRFSVNGFGLYEHLDEDIETRQYGAGTDATWHRPTSTGELHANLALAYDQAATHGDAGRRYVRQEVHAIGGVRPVFLRQRGVIVSSVVAHDERYTRIYVPGVDYVAVPMGQRVFIRRIPWGRIAEDQVVYFDYSYQVPAESRVNSYRTDFRIEHAFDNGLTPYYYFEGRFQEVDQSSIANPWERDSQNRHRIGTRYELERFSLDGQYEVFDDTTNPFDAWHLIAQAGLFNDAVHSLDLQSELSHYKFEGDYDNRRVWYFDLNLKDRAEIGGGFSSTAGAQFRRECDDVRGDTTGVDIEWALRYIRGYLSVELTLEYDLLSVVENRENGFSMYLSVRRNLTHLLPSEQARR